MDRQRLQQALHTHLQAGISEGTWERAGAHFDRICLSSCVLAGKPLPYRFLSICILKASCFSGYCTSMEPDQMYDDMSCKHQASCIPAQGAWQAKCVHMNGRNRLPAPL